MAQPKQFNIRKKMANKSETSELEQAVSDTTAKIARVLGYPKEVYSERKIDAEYNENGGHSILTGKMQVNHNNLLILYEESGHRLHNLVNPDIMSLVGLLIESPETFTPAFFTGALCETIGYFCSRLSGKPRNENHMETIRQEKIMLSRVNQRLEQIQRSLENFDDEHNEVTDYKRTLEHHKRTLEYSEEAYDRGFKIYKLISKPELCKDSSELNKLIFQRAFSKIRMVQNGKVNDSLVNLFHAMGYDLGADLYNFYLEKPEEAVKTVRKIMETKYEDSTMVFVDVYRKFNCQDKEEGK